MGTYGSFAYLILMLLDVLSTITLSSWRCKIKLGLFACSLGSSARREERIEKPAWQLLYILAAVALKRHVWRRNFIKTEHLVVMVKEKGTVVI